MDEIKNRIINIDFMDDEMVKELLKDIKALDPEERLEASDLYIKTAKEFILGENLTKEELKESIMVFRGDLKGGIGLSQTEINTIFNANKFDLKSLLSEEEEENLAPEMIDESTPAEPTPSVEPEETEEITKLYKYINDIEKHIGKTLTLTQIDEEIKNLDTLKANEMKEIDSQIEKVKSKLNILLLEREEHKYESLTDENLEDVLKNLLDERNEFIYSRVSTEDEEYQKVEEEISRIQKEKDKRAADKFYGKTNDELQAELDAILLDIEKIKNMTIKKGTFEAKLNEYRNKTELATEIKKELEKRENEKYKSISDEVLEKLLDNLIHDRDSFIIARISPNDEEFKEIEDEIARIQMEQNRRKKVESIEKLEKEKKELEKRQKLVQSTYDKQLQPYHDLKDLNRAKNAYCKILNDSINKLGNEKMTPEELNEEIEELFNHHPLVPELNRYHNANKLTNELKDKIYDSLTPKKVEKKEKNQKLLWKGLAAVSGFATGMVLSSVPGVGTIRMGIATAKLATSAINFATKKFPESKFTKLVNNTGNKLNKKFPRMMNKIRDAKEKLNSSPMNYFINGVSAGYITGNIIEMVTGESVLEHVLGDKNETFGPYQQVSENIEMPNPADIILNQGDVIDISSLEYGFMAETDTNPVHLMNKYGKEVIVDMFRQNLDGEVMVHLKQMNGLGYAWFKLSDVQDVLAKSSQIVQTTKIL